MSDDRRGDTRLQPVHVDDVALAVARIFDLERPPANLFELGGPRSYCYRELLALIAAVRRRRRWFMPMPFVIWELLALLLAQLPQRPLTRDQVALMRRDNVTAADIAGFAELGIEPRALQDLLIAGKSETGV